MNVTSMGVRWGIVLCGTLSHWGRVTHICVSKLTIIGSDNGLSPGQRQAIIWTNAGILLIGPLGIKFIEILLNIYTFPFKKMRLKMSSGKIRPFHFGLNVLSIPWHFDLIYHYVIITKIMWTHAMEDICVEDNLTCYALQHIKADMLPLFVASSDFHGFWWWSVACSVPSYVLNQLWPSLLKVLPNSLTAMRTPSTTTITPSGCVIHLYLLPHQPTLSTTTRLCLHGCVHKSVIVVVIILVYFS